MRALSSSDFLEMWERGAALHPVDRGLVALQTTFSETYDKLADWPLGRRNQALAALRCSCFGPRMEAWTACPRCAEKLEFQIDARTLAASSSPACSSVEVNGRCFRLPTSRDMALAARETDLRAAAVRIMEACFLHDGEPPDWSEQDIDQVGQQMALADPMAEIRLTLECPVCTHKWDETLDLTAFFWTEIAARARGLLRDVHTLASAYGWSEREIVSLTEARRATYLEMCQA